MGGGGSSGSSRIDLPQLTAAADERLKKLVETGTQILFVCYSADRSELEALIANSNVLNSEKHVVFDETQSDRAMAAIDKSSLVVVFTSKTKTEDYLNDVVNSAAALRKQGIHVRGSGKAIIPQRVASLRWPSKSWAEFEKIVGA